MIARVLLMAELVACVMAFGYWTGWWNAPEGVILGLLLANVVAGLTR